MDIGLESRLGVPVGVAYVVAAHARLETKFTSHNSESLPFESLSSVCVAIFRLFTGYSPADLRLF